MESVLPSFLVYAFSVQTNCYTQKGFITAKPYRVLEDAPILAFAVENCRI